MCGMSVTTLLRCYQQGESEPLHFYPKTSYAWAKAKSETAKWNAARRTWFSGFYRGESDDPAYELALRAQDPLDQRFAELAQPCFSLWWIVCKSMREGRVSSSIGQIEYNEIRQPKLTCSLSGRINSINPSFFQDIKPLPDRSVAPPLLGQPYHRASGCRYVKPSVLH